MTLLALRRSWRALLLLILCPAVLSAEVSPGENASWPQKVATASYRSRDAEIARLRARLAPANPENFEPFLQRQAGGPTMPYRLFTPELATGEKYPLVLVLHGSGGRGNDNLAQIAGNSAVTAGHWTLPENQKAHPCFVLVPQCPAEPSAWIKAADWDDQAHPFQPEPTPAMRMVMAILDRVCREQPIDPTRLYVLGSSMGGYGTWDLLTRAPDRFAAAIPICGGLADEQAPRIAHVAQWIFHGTADDVIPVSSSRRAFAQLRAAGSAPRYTEFEGAGHSIAAYAVTEPGLMEWLFAQKLRR